MKNYNEPEELDDDELEFDDCHELEDDEPDYRYDDYEPSEFQERQSYWQSLK